MPFDQHRADLAIGFFERYLVLVKGPHKGQPIKLAKWQRELISELFGRVREDGTRQYRECFCVIPKKNGKSMIAAGIALYMITVDTAVTGEFSPEVNGIAFSRDQASEVYNLAADMVELSPKLQQFIPYRDHLVVRSRKRIINPHNKGLYVARAAEARGIHGANSSAVIGDEIHAMRDGEALDALTEGMGTRREPLVFLITNHGEVGSSPVYWEKYEYAKAVAADPSLDPTFFPVIYEAPAEVKDEELLEEGPHWYTANPVLEEGILDIDDMRRACRQAKKQASKRQRVLRLRCGRSVQPDTALIKVQDWDACEAKFSEADMVGKDCFVGVDFSAKIDFTAVVFEFPESDGKYVWLEAIWVPEGMVEDLERRTDQPLRSWIESGDLLTTPGMEINYAVVEDWVLEKAKLFNVKELGFDPWNATRSAQRIEQEGYEGKVFQVGQNYSNLSEPCKDFEALVINHKLRHRKNPCTRWMASCVATVADKKDNVTPSKPDRRASGKRIDVISAGIVAHARAMRHQGPQELTAASISFG